MDYRYKLEDKNAFNAQRERIIKTALRAVTSPEYFQNEARAIEYTQTRHHETLLITRETVQRRYDQTALVRLAAMISTSPVPYGLKQPIIREGKPSREHLELTLEKLQINPLEIQENILNGQVKETYTQKVMEQILKERKEKTDDMIRAMINSKSSFRVNSKVQNKKLTY